MSKRKNFTEVITSEHYRCDMCGSVINKSDIKFSHDSEDVCETCYGKLPKDIFDSFELHKGWKKEAADLFINNMFFDFRDVYSYEIYDLTKGIWGIFSDAGCDCRLTSIKFKSLFDFKEYVLVSENIATVKQQELRITFIDGKLRRFRTRHEIYEDLND